MYWWSVYNLARRQVHDPDREVERTTHTDAQRAFFQTLVVMLRLLGYCQLHPRQSRAAEPLANAGPRSTTGFRTTSPPASDGRVSSRRRGGRIPILPTS